LVGGTDEVPGSVYYRYIEYRPIDYVRNAATKGGKGGDVQ